MPEVKDVWVCECGCEARVIGMPDKGYQCDKGGHGWFACTSHSEKCNQHMCRETEKWLAGLS